MLAAILQRRMWERARESGERFWHNRIAVKTHCQNEEGGIILYEGEMRDPSWMNYKCHPSKREKNSRRAL
jgi:hypothetical protein